MGSWNVSSSERAGCCLWDNTNRLYASDFRPNSCEAAQQLTIKIRAGMRSCPHTTITRRYNLVTRLHYTRHSMQACFWLIVNCDPYLRLYKDHISL
jgi:hypothetical protein